MTLDDSHDEVSSGDNANVTDAVTEAVVNGDATDEGPVVEAHVESVTAATRTRRPPARFIG